MKKISGLLVVAVLLLTNSVAAIDYSKNEEYYQDLCRKQSSYNANKTTCQGYEDYLRDISKDLKQSAQNIRDQIAEIKDDIEKLGDLIRQNTLLIEKKEMQISRNRSEIKKTQNEIINLENEIMERIALMQEINSENFLVDFIMNAVSLEDFIIKMNGINAINESNNELINDLEDAKKKLKIKENNLKEEEKELKQTQANQTAMLKAFRTKESELFKSLEEETRRRAVYNTKLNNINIGGITNSKGFIRPTSGYISAVAWYYPASFGGGWHPGMDIANGTGTIIKAPASGVVLATGSHGNSGYGNFMVSAHQVGNDTYTFIYGHLSGYAKFGSSVKQGQTLAYMGSTGFSTGPHTHLEVFKHNNQSLKEVVNEYRKNGDLYFGLGYGSVGSCSSTCRVAPQSFFSTSYGSSF